MGSSGPAKSVKSIKTGLNKALGVAGLEGVHPHVFRHMAAVQMAAADRPMERIAHDLGRAKVATTRHVSARFAPSHRQEEADVLAVAPTACKGSQVRRTREHSAKKGVRRSSCAGRPGRIRTCNQTVMSGLL